ANVAKHQPTVGGRSGADHTGQTWTTPRRNVNPPCPATTAARGASESVPTDVTHRFPIVGIRPVTVRIVESDVRYAERLAHGGFEGNSKCNIPIPKSQKPKNSRSTLRQASPIHV